jgi:hypothetical protein
MMPSQEIKYGVTTGMFVTRMPGKDTVVLGGEGEGDKWTRVLSIRSAHALWLHLTELFFPEKAREVFSIVVTAPLRGADKPAITIDVQVDVTDDGMVKLSGTTPKQQWTAMLSAPEARRLWQVLDKALYPLGWQGPTITAGSHQ